MKYPSILTLSAVAATTLLALASPSRADDEDEEISLDKVPAPAAEAIKKWAKGEAVTKVVVEKEGKVTAYEALVKGKGDAKREITVDAAGKTLSEESVIALTEAPKEVQAAAAALGGKVLLVEKIIEGEETSFEVEFEKDGKKSEVELTAGGNVKPAEKEEDDDDGKEEKDDDDDKKGDKDDDDDDDEDDDETKEEK